MRSRMGVRWSDKHHGRGGGICFAAVVGVVVAVWLLHAAHQPPTTRRPVATLGDVDSIRADDSVHNLDDEWRTALHAVRALKEHLGDAPRPPVLHQQQEPHPHRGTGEAAHQRVSLDDLLASTRASRRQSDRGGILVGGDDENIQAQQDHQREDDYHQASSSVVHDSTTLFVSMASFRDAECAPTLLDMFRTAAHPARVFVGVVEQSDPLVDPQCLSTAVRNACLSVRAVEGGDAGRGGAATARGAFWSRRRGADAHQPTSVDGDGGVGSRYFCFSDNVRVRRTRPQEARGPTFGRYVAASMYQGETFFMMIDSHNRFVEAWDRLIVREYLRTVLRRRQAHKDRLDAKGGGNRTGDAALSSSSHPFFPEKVILSHYPAAYAGPHAVVDHGREPHMRLMCSGHFLETGILRLDAESILTPTAPVRQPFTAAGFLFANASLLQDVPFDKYLDFVFDGEEVLYSARAYTWGWDSYLPTVNVMYHFYGRPHSPKVWSVSNNLWWMHQKVSHIRVLMLLNQTADLAVFQTKEPGPFMDARVRMDLDRYGMGPVRSLEQFWQYAAIDPKRKRHTTRGGASMYCRMLLAAKP